MNMMASLLSSKPVSEVPSVEVKFLSLAFEHPSWSCARLNSFLRIPKMSASFLAVQNILHKCAMSTKYQRIRKLKRAADRGTVQLSAEQRHWLERADL